MFSTLTGKLLRSKYPTSPVITQTFGKRAMAKLIPLDLIIPLKTLILDQFRLQLNITVKSALSGHSKKDQTKIFMTIGSLMKVESTGVCRMLPFCNTFQGLFQLFWEKAPGLNCEKICAILGYFWNLFRSVNC